MFLELLGFGDCGHQELRVTVALCNYFLLMLLLAVAFESWIPLGQTEWPLIPFVFCFLQEICISFMFRGQRENQGNIHLWSSLWVSVLDPD